MQPLPTLGSRALVNDDNSRLLRLAGLIALRVGRPFASRMSPL